MQKAQQLICTDQVTDPCVPSRVDQAETVSNKDVEDDNDGVGWMDGNDDVGHKATQGTNKSYTPLA